MANIFADLPGATNAEVFQTLLMQSGVRIERIVSRGQKCPADFWYDQAQDEWVLLLAGQARLQFADLTMQTLSVGDYCFIPAHCKHRVDWTDPAQETLWLAIHFAQ